MDKWVVYNGHSYQEQLLVDWVIPHLRNAGCVLPTLQLERRSWELCKEKHGHLEPLSKLGYQLFVKQQP